MNLLLDNFARRLALQAVLLKEQLNNIKDNDTVIDELNKRELIRKCYYFLFQIITLTCTSKIIGIQDIDSKNWVKFFRNYNHKELRDRLKMSHVKAISPIIDNFSKSFELLQDERLKADYDPHVYHKSKQELITMVDTAQKSAFDLSKLDNLQIRTLAIALLFKDRP